MQTCTFKRNLAASAGHRSLESVDMQIPGTVLSGLLAAGKIKDPFYRTNEDATRALFWKDYVFTRTFDVDEELLAQQHTVLVCEGLDAAAGEQAEAEAIEKRIAIRQGNLERNRTRNADRAERIERGIWPCHQRQRRDGKSQLFRASIAAV